MKQLAIVLTFLAFAVPAHAQTLASPTSATPTVVCITVNSISTAVTLTPAAACFGMTDAVAGQLLAAYAPYCQASNLVGTPPVATACTPQQIVTFLAGSIETGIQGNVASYLRAQASQAAAAAVVAAVAPDVGASGAGCSPASTDRHQGSSANS